jgi:DNA-binding helix-hairpin-helix protein with protein kinase domain
MSNFAPKPGLTLYTADNRPMTLDWEIGRGGEGAVWSIAGSFSSDVVAKFYHHGLSFDKAKKEDRGDVPAEVGRAAAYRRLAH